MNDKELLELAAKAAGIEIELCHFGPSKSFFIVEDGRLKEQWNPLKGDAQALCLAVKLEMNLFFGLAKIFVEIPSDGDEPSIVEKNEKGNDPYAATRRAIVRAAAEIGRGME